MDGTQNSILADDLYARLGTALAQLLRARPASPEANSHAASVVDTGGPARCVLGRDRVSHVELVRGAHRAMPL
jgi:hypothetical protein